MTITSRSLTRSCAFNLGHIETIDVSKKLQEIHSLNNSLSLECLAILKVLSLNLTEDQLSILPPDLKNVITMKDIDPQKAIELSGSEDEKKKFSEMIDKTQQIKKHYFSEFAMAKFVKKPDEDKIVFNKVVRDLENLPPHLRMIFLSVMNSNRYGLSCSGPEHGCTFLQLALLEKEEKIAFKILELLDVKNRKTILLSKNIHKLNALDIAKDNEKLTKDLISYLSEKDRNGILSRMEE